VLGKLNTVRILSCVAFRPPDESTMADWGLVQDLAAHFADGRLSTEKLLAAEDEELYTMLTSIRGIGRVSPTLYHERITQTNSHRQWSGQWFLGNEPTPAITRYEPHHSGHVRHILTPSSKHPTSR